MDDSDGCWVRGMTMADMRKQDLRAQRMRDFGKPPRRTWGMFESEGTVEDGVWRRRWCIYPEDEDDRAYSTGLWFTDPAAASMVRDWKMAREKARPRALTRVVVQAWRALPWR